MIREPRWGCIIPISQKPYVLRPAGFIRDWRLTSYDNGCINVQPVEGTQVTYNNTTFSLGWSYDRNYRNGRDLGFTYKVSSFFNPVLGQYFFYNYPTDRIYGSKTEPKDSDYTASDIGRILQSENRYVFYSRDDRPSHILGNYRRSNFVSERDAGDIITLLNSRDQTEPFFNQLYIDAASELKITSNSWANALELVELVKSLRNPVQFLKETLENIPKGVKLAKDLWLKYRYMYNTTKADVEEIKQKASILTDGGPQRLRASGSSNLSELHLRIDAKPYTGYIDPFSNLFINMERYGFEPSLYNAWDLIPFSFVADWFLPIGDTLEELSKETWAMTMPYSVSALCSRKVSSFEYGARRYKIYERGSFEPTYKSFASNSKTSMHTWAKRGLDLVSLL